MDFSQLKPAALLALHAQIGEELRTRGITRTCNNPTGDLGEYLFCKAFGWTQSRNSHPNTDAIGPDGKRYQIKARRITRYNKSRQLGALRGLGEAHFEILAGVLFAEDYAVMRAALVPYSVALERAIYVNYTNSYKLMLQDDVWDAPGVRDVTTELRAVIL